MRLVFLILFFLSFSLSSIHAQFDSSDRENYALLWEISGNGLETSSYVFGSMHVRKDFAFQFPDSLLYYLSQCDAFANEIHLDSAMLRMFEVYLGDEEIQTDSSYIAFIKTKKVQTDSSTFLEEMENMDLDSLLNSINLDDIDVYEDVVLGDYTENKPTMLDAYLMNIASSQGKDFYGLEKIDNHFYDGEPSSSGFSFYNSSEENLESYYYQGDLEAIQEIIENEASAYDDLQLIPRNYIMVESMLKIMSDQSLFSVVGAAHLPGEEGVIELLREQGYHLRSVLPIFSQQGKKAMRQLALEQNKGIKKRPWLSMETEGSRFNASIPLPYLYKTIAPFESNYLQVDIGRGLFYLILTSSMAPDDYDNFDENFFENDGYEIINKSPYSINGIEGHEYKLKKYGEDVEHFKGYVFIKNGELYYLQIGAYEENTFINSSDPKYFIEHFFIEKTAPGKWVTIVDSIGAFTVNLPRNYVSRSNTNYINSYVKWVTTYSAGFGDEQSSIGLKYFDRARFRMTTESDSSAFENELENAEEYLGVSLEVSKRENKKWFFEGEYEDKKLTVSGFIQMRGERIYTLFSIDKKGFPSTKKFLKSFHLTPYSTNRLTEPVYLADSLFQCYMPKKIKSTEYDPTLYSDSAVLSSKTIRSTDINCGFQYEVNIDKLHPLFGTTDTLKYLKENASDFHTDLVFDTTARPTSFPSVMAHFDQGMRQVYINEDYIITKTVYGDSVYLLSPICKQFFEEDVWRENRTVSPTLLENKGDTLLRLLASQDTSYWPLLNTAIEPEYSFEKRHSMELKEQLLQTEWSDSNVSIWLQAKLLSAFILVGDSNIITPNLVDLFEPSAPKSSLRMTILSELTKIDDPVAQDAFFNLLSRDNELCYNASRFVFAAFFRDSSLFINNTNNIKELLTTQKDHLLFWEMAVSIFNESEEGKKAVTAIINDFVTRGGNRLESYRSESLNKNDFQNIENGAPYYVLDLYRLFPTNKAIQTQINRLLDRNYNDDISVEAARFFFDNEQDILNAKLKQLLKNPATSVAMIRLLNEQNLLASIKSKYYDREVIAKGILIEQFKTDQLVVSEIEFEETVIGEVAGESKLFYVFSFTLEEKPSILAIVGQFSTDKDERHFVDSDNVNYTDYPVVKRRRTRKAKALIEALEEVDYDWLDFELDDIDY